MNNSYPHLWQYAAELSAKAHRHQTRKDGVTPYIMHPMRVCLTLSQVFHVTDESILAAALLHDVIEDTSTDYDDVEEVCSAEVADIVAALSKDARVAHDPRELAYQQQLDNASWKVKIIKLADIYDNICDAVKTRSKINVWSPAEHAIKGAEGIPQLQQAALILKKLLDEHEADRIELQK